jgi:cell division protein FtsB
MKYPIIYFPFMKVSGMALFPFILVSKKAFINNSEIIRHETIHLKQQLELLIIPFYLLYFLNYVINLYRYKNHYKAYYQIIFEREAYAKDKDILYLRNRPLWAFMTYWNKKIKE